MTVREYSGEIQLHFVDEEVNGINVWAGKWSQSCSFFMAIDKVIELRDLLSAEIERRAALPGKETVTNVAG
jgi:hypothetical protein